MGKTLDVVDLQEPVAKNRYRELQVTVPIIGIFSSYRKIGIPSPFRTIKKIPG